jgi:hypothetical protein
VDGFLQSVASGFGGLVAGSLALIGQTLRSMVATLDHLLPGGLLAGVIFVALAIGAWQLAKR